jgi:ABC-type multidrug transport system ATPase subunit
MPAAHTRDHQYRHDHNPYVLTLSRATKAYRAGMPGCSATVDVLRGLSLRLRRGQTATIEGAPGSGKTTLLMCAAGMLRLDEGSVRWPALRARSGRSPAGIAFVGDRAPTYGFLTVRESVAYAATVREVCDAQPVADVGAILDTMALASQSDTRVGLLTRAERARFLIGLALIGAPELLLIDDLAPGDGSGAAEFAGSLARVAAAGTAVMWATRTPGIASCPGVRYELLNGRLRRMTHKRAHAVETPLAPDANVLNGAEVHAELHASRRVAEP